MAQLLPLGRNVLVVLEQRRTAAAGRIVLPDICRNAKPSEASIGQVVGIGEKVSEVACDDYVIIPPHKGTAYLAKGEKFVVVNEAQILARLSAQNLDAVGAVA